MGLRFTSQLNIDALPAEALNSEFEVIMPTLNVILGATDESSSSNNSEDENKSFLESAKNALFGDSVSYNYTPIVEQIKFTPRSFSTDQRRIRTQWTNVPNDLENLQKVQIIMFCSNGMLTQYYLDAWRNLIFDKKGEYYNPMETYKKNIEIYFYGAASVSSYIPVAHFTLKGCFPVSQGSYDLKYSSKPDRITISADFSVDRIVSDPSMARSSAIREIGASPLSIADRVFQNLTEQASAYSLSDTTD